MKKSLIIIFLMATFSPMLTLASEIYIYKNNKGEAIFGSTTDFEFEDYALQEKVITSKTQPTDGEIELIYEKNPELRPIKNTVIDGYRLESYSNGKAYVSRDGGRRLWDIDCKRDRISDQKTCFLSQFPLTIMFINKRAFVGVGSSVFPASSSAIRIDGGVPFLGTEGFFEDSARIVAALKKGRSAITRYQKWPYEANIDDEIDLSGINVSIKYITGYLSGK